MDESLTEQRRVSEEGFRIVKLCQPGRMYNRLRAKDIDGTGEGSHG